ncbi:response regulator [Caulobacter sp.]|uniref:response regulator n=1 Tax=Caulobacter sp. TaxID=78 RepID=UPI003BAFDD8E
MSFDLLKILLVDDNQHMRMLLTEILRSLGVRQIFEAMDGAEALQLMRDTQMDLVMSDLTMSPLDGIDFVNLLRNSPDSPGPFTPVIMITGHSTMRRVAEARDAGVNEFLAKPVTARAVIHRINLIIEHPRPFIRCAGYFGPDRRRREDPAFAGPWRRQGDPGVVELQY